jgi:glycine/sarcosine N-methyltransferase
VTPGSEPADGVRAFYDDLAPTYDRIFADWRASSRRQGEVLSAVLAGELGPGPHRVADVACGIGTQLIGLATAGHLVCGSDVSMRAVERAAAHVADAVAAGSFAASRVAGLAVADMRALPYADGCFDAVVCADNSLSHLLTPDGARTALGHLRRVLRSGAWRW